MLHKQKYLFVQFNSKKVNVCFLILSYLLLPSLTSFLVHFQLLPKSAAPETIAFFLPGCLPGIEDRAVLSDLYNLFSQSWSKLTSVNNQVNINYKEMYHHSQLNVMLIMTL